MCRGFEAGERHRLSKTPPTKPTISHPQGPQRAELLRSKDKGLRTRYQTKAAKFAEIREGQMSGMILYDPPNEVASHRLNLVVFSRFS
jgi:hypothetical protein